MQPVEEAEVSTLTPHPRNYRDHPDDQLEHLAASITEHGFYRNIVIARDGTILAGHGVVQAATQKLGLTTVPVIRLDVEPDSPAALKVLAGDNEMARLAGIDDRALSEILRDLNEQDALLGTGYDDEKLALLILSTRHATEIPDEDAAREWAGMPGYEGAEEPFKLVVAFENADDRQAFIKRAKVGIMRANPESKTWSGVYPAKPREDVASLRVE